MGDPKNHQPLLDECRTIAENCLYTAQAHYVMSKRAYWRGKVFLIIPSCVSAVAGILTAVGLPGWIGAFAAAAGLVSAVASTLGVAEDESAHTSAGNLFTCLRHEARAIHETFYPDLTHEQLLSEVRRLSDRYNCLVQGTKSTDDKSFTAGREKIRSGTFTPDFRETRDAEKR